MGDVNLARTLIVVWDGEVYSSGSARNLTSYEEAAESVVRCGECGTRHGDREEV